MKLERPKLNAKLHTSGGFSFAELMLTMLILALMTGMLAQGIPVVIHTYQTAVDTANAETYLNTTMIALRSRLCVSKPVLNDHGDIILYYEYPQTGYYNIRNAIEDKDKDGNRDAKGIQIVQYLDIDRTRYSELPLAPSEKGKEKGTFVSFFGTFNDDGIFQGEPITYEGDFFTIPKLQVTTKDEMEKAIEERRKPNSLAELDAPYVIHTVNAALPSD